MARGVKRDHRRLFVIDGSKVLRLAINAVFGTQHPVQRCRAHKLRNVLDRLPKRRRAKRSRHCLQPGSWMQKPAWRA